MESFLFKCINILSFSEVAIDVDECDYQRATLHIRKSFFILILWNNLVSVCVCLHLCVTERFCLLEFRPTELFEPITGRGAANCCFIGAVWE